MWISIKTTNNENANNIYALHTKSKVKGGIKCKFELPRMFKKADHADITDCSSLEVNKKTTTK